MTNAYPYVLAEHKTLVMDQVTSFTVHKDKDLEIETENCYGQAVVYLDERKAKALRDFLNEHYPDPVEDTTDVPMFLRPQAC